MNTRRGSGRHFLLTCTAVAVGAISLTGCTLEQAATNAIGMESAGKAFSSFFDFAHFTTDPDTDESENVDIDSPGE